MSSSLLSKLLLLGAAIHSATAQTATSTDSASATSNAYRELFSPPSSVDTSEPLLPNIKNPDAVDAQDVCPGYTATNVQEQPYGVTAQLALAGPPCNAYGSDVSPLDLTVQRQSDDRLNIEIKPSYTGPENASWFEPPHFVTKPGIDNDADTAKPLLDLDFVWGNDPSFWFSVVRKSNSEVLFSTQGNKLIFEDQFVEFKSPLPQDYNLYGLAETIRPFRLSNNFTKTFWAADVGDVIDANIYGTHPIYYDTRYYDADTGDYVPWNQTSLDTSYTSLTHGLYYRNTHGQEVLLEGDGITWRTLGGNIDLFLYAGPTVEEVAKSYQKSAIGLPALQQYFTFGYHQCRWGYTNWTELQDVVDNFTDFGIPLENIWSDIDYMKLFRDFTLDPVAFPQEQGQQFLAGLHEGGRHYIPIVDSAIYIPNPDNSSDDYATYHRGHDADAFMLEYENGPEYIGTVWPGYTVFPDWFSEGTQDWWTNEMRFYAENITVDGIWIDMSEVSSFCIGSCGTFNLTLNPAPGGIPTAAPTSFPEGFEITNGSEASSASSVASSISATSSVSSSQSSSFFSPPTPTPGHRNVSFPPYTINNYNGDLRVHGMEPNGTHHNGVLDYDVHNLWGWQILNATYNALLEVFPGKRPFIIGRSTFAGAGQVAGHWGGDNYSLWAYMVFSISQALSFSLSGIPMFGVDTCGFSGNTDEELCNRWMQLSAFFPFYRNHNLILALSQEPYRWESVTDATIAAQDVRFALLPYMYTLFYQAHTTGSTVMRALAWEFPNDPSLADADHQFLLGPSILVTPVLEQGASTVNGVFPGNNAGGNERWYDWYNNTEITDAGAKSGQNVTIDAPLGHMPVYVRGGAVLPLQPRNGVLTTADARKQSWSVLAALNSTGGASGSLYLDDGESLVQNATKHVGFALSGTTLSAKVTGEYADANPIANVTVLGVSQAPGAVSLNGQQVESIFDQENGVLSVTGLDKLTDKGAWAASWTLSWG